MTQNAGTKIERHTSSVDSWLRVRRLASRKIRGPSASLGMTQGASDTKTEGESERLSSTFRDFFSLGAGVTPAEGSGETHREFHIQ
jgi:hypothetical protein